MSSNPSGFGANDFVSPISRSVSRNELTQARYSRLLLSLNVLSLA
jgi:hypothetical protein